MTDQQIAQAERQLEHAKKLREKLIALRDLKSNWRSIRCEFAYMLGGATVRLSQDVLNEILELGYEALHEKTFRAYERAEITSVLPEPIAVEP